MQGNASRGSLHEFYLNPENLVVFLTLDPSCSLEQCTIVQVFKISDVLCIPFL